jgi:hypothetical protein
MNAASKDIKDMLLADSSLGLALGTNLFVGREPATPRACITLFDTGGGTPGMSLDANSYYYTQVQVRVRNPDYNLGMVQSYEIMDALHGRGQAIVNGTLYTLITCTEPMLLDYDDQNNVRFIININMQRHAV